ncbi:hypothetical protein BT96DRAFT_677457 [Gymnopus androsaceus JB14]|uniref:ZZ-type domain-containing protein n=1 Tax=Gymnopus androsaceus JB14 TaxID=1447944 RepID=A0A6A4HSK9_9AGAR|nr:hypothetical protein BT96DRAFT_677457 [Gymnopus androsaceus JB14]
MIAAKLLQDIPPTTPNEEDITGCSECGVKLDSMKYVCSTCGEKDPGFHLQLPSHKGERRDSSGRLFTDLPSANTQVYASPLSPTFSSSSKTLLGNKSTYFGHKPLPPVPSLGGSSSRLMLSTNQANETGYELCPNCMEIAGVTHAIAAIVEPGSSPAASNILSSSLEDAALQWIERRAAPKQKGQLRHAYLEKMWGHGGWTDVVQSEADTEDCSTCGVAVSLEKQYRCASCPRYYLCRACYSQVHDLHPSHAFLVLPDKLFSSLSDSEITLLDHSEEQSMGTGIIREERGINCDACRKPIFGVRYQCANCPAPQWGYNLCSNCEEASYRVHDSLHAFFKLPRRVNRPIQSNFPMIPVIYKMPAGPSPAAYDVRDPTGYLRSIVHPAAVCDRCVTRIQGAWFHCAHCRKDLCSSCESVDTHDDTHVFLVFKALIDMQKLRIMVEMDNPENSLPVISYPVYNSS